MLGEQRGAMMDEIIVEERIEAPPDVVWAVITNIENAADVISGISVIVHPFDDRDFDVGFTWRETRRMFGKDTTEEMQVVAVDDGRSYDVESDSHGTRYFSTTSVLPDGDGCVLRMAFRGEAQNTLSKVMGATLGRLFEGPTRRAIQQDLRDIAAEAQRRAQS